MSRCIRNGVLYARHRNGEDGICTACGHKKGTPSQPLDLVTQEEPNVTTNSTDSAVESLENEGGAVKA